MKATLALAGLIFGLLPPACSAAPAHKNTAARKTATATTYQCSKFHMTNSAVQAKKNHYKDPMDGGTLVPVVPKKAPAKG